MGYDLHITRVDEWVEAETNPITLDEWRNYVENDPEMRMDGYAEAVTSQGETVRLESEGLAVWVAYSKHGEGGNMAWFLWSGGQVIVKNPDQEIIRKMVEIASMFKGQVRGDEDELYGSDGEMISDLE